VKASYDGIRPNKAVSNAPIMAATDMGTILVAEIRIVRM
jgi:hypothetical protein